MLSRFHSGTATAFFLAGAITSMLFAAAGAEVPAPVAISVTVAPTLGASNSGRLLVFAKRADPGAAPEKTVDTSPFDPTGTSVLGREVADLSPGHVASLDTDIDSFPAPFTTLPPGLYRFQAVLDRNHDYNYSGRVPGDLESTIVEATLPGPVPMLVLDHAVPASDPVAPRLARMSAEQRARFEAAEAAVKPIDFVSPALSAFSGRPVHVRGWIALPPGYESGHLRYPTVFAFGGFSSTLSTDRYEAAQMQLWMEDKTAAPMIWVWLDQSCPTGIHEFTDSVNNGPWGRALSSELIPSLEAQYRMDARPSGRFLFGHSSGGWTRVWLQVTYPRLFGGAWPSSPDPTDFHDFVNVDLYRADANLYRDAAGQPVPLFRYQGKVIATAQQFIRLEAVLGSGGQYGSFDWVFSPKGADGLPMPMFDRRSGKVDPAVAAYWTEHYDVASIIAHHWDRLRPDLDGKLHLIVGTEDSFYLDGSAHRLQAVLNGLGAKDQFRFVPGKSHFDILSRGDDQEGLDNDLSWEMYRAARPSQKN
jgi:hypothetical protein